MALYHSEKSSISYNLRNPEFAFLHVPKPQKMLITLFLIFWHIWKISASPKFNDLKIGQKGIRIFPYLDRILSLSIWEKVQIRFCPYMGKYRSEKARVLAKFTQWNTFHKPPCKITFPWRTFWIILVRLVFKKLVSLVI